MAAIWKAVLAAICLVAVYLRYGSAFDLLKGFGSSQEMRGWQLQIVHGRANAEFVRGLFTPAELATIRLVCLGVDNLSRRAYSELVCSHWLWERPPSAPPATTKDA